jgi:dipeptidyl aminopeptidase/acylaminoacyl peptidase
MRKLIWLALALAPLAHAAPAPLTPESMWQLKRLGPPAISPDGKTAVVQVTTFDMKEDKGFSDLWAIPTAGGAARQMTTHTAGDSAPAFSPDGSLVAFSAQRDGDTAPQIYVLPMAGGEARRVTQVPTGAGLFRFTPDSRQLVFVTRVFTDLKTWDEQGKRLKERSESKMVGQAWDRAPVRHWDQFIDERQAHLYVVSVDGGEPRALTLSTNLELPRQEQSIENFEISPDGQTLAFVADSARDQTVGNLDVFVLPMAGGTAKNLTTDNPGIDTNPSFSPDGKLLAFNRQTIIGFYGDERRLMIHDLSRGGNREIADGWDRSKDNLQWLPNNRGLIGAIDDAGTVRLWEIPLSGEPRAITREASFSPFALDASGKTIVALRQSFSEPPTLVRVDPRSGNATKLSTFNDAALANIQMGETRSETYIGADGVEIQMWVTYPPGFDQSKKYPLFLILHGGPHNGITDGFAWRWNAQIFAGWGYVSAWHNFHGSSGFGQAFTDSINPDQDRLPYIDTIKAAEHFAAQPFIDKDRMVAGGGSYGGYLASTVLGREHPFKALIAHAAVYNWYTQYAADYAGEPARDGNEFWLKPELFKGSSPHFGAGNFDTPTLVIHGQLDYRVPVTHGIELFNTLQRKGVPSRFVYYPNENHWILKPNNSLNWYQEVRTWVERYAKP